MAFIRISVKVPKEIINVERVRQAIIDVQNTRTRQKLVQLFGRTVQGWHDRPDFHSRRVDTTSQLGIRVFADGPNAKQYALINGGARPHIIQPRRARVLRFRPGYRAGTRPRVLSSTAYQRSGDFVSANVVHHPGFTAREFTDVIAETHEPEFEKDMQEAISSATRK